jgi:chromosome segregation ATPase
MGAYAERKADNLGELVDLHDATVNLRRARSTAHGESVGAALFTLEALIAEAHVARRAVASRPPDVADLVNAVIDAAGRMLETIHGISNGQATAEALNASRIHADRLKRDLELQRRGAQDHVDKLRDEIKARAAVEAQRVEEITALRRELDEMLGQYAACGELAESYRVQVNALKREVANLELAVAEARGDV